MFQKILWMASHTNCFYFFSLLPFDHIRFACFIADTDRGLFIHTHYQFPCRAKPQWHRRQLYDTSFPKSGKHVWLFRWYVVLFSVLPSFLACYSPLYLAYVFCVYSACYGPLLSSWNFVTFTLIRLTKMDGLISVLRSITWRLLAPLEPASLRRDIVLSHRLEDCATVSSASANRRFFSLRKCAHLIYRCPCDLVPVILWSRLDLVCPHITLVVMRIYCYFLYFFIAGGVIFVWAIMYYSRTTFDLYLVFHHVCTPHWRIVIFLKLCDYGFRYFYYVSLYYYWDRVDRFMVRSGLVILSRHLWQLLHEFNSINPV